MEEQVLIREYDAQRDFVGVELLERRCEVGTSGKASLLTDLMGDPICRIRHAPAFIMLVAEMGGEEVVGVVRGCIKTVTCGKKIPRNARNGSEGSNSKPVPVFTKAAYVLGLRVSPSHRRRGIGLKLVTRLESWFRNNGAEYAYMATARSNEASLGLFTRRLGYSKFRAPAVLVQPVHAHRKPLPRGVRLLHLSPSEAQSLYCSRSSTVEFFPRDIGTVLSNALTLGTFLVVPSSFPAVDFATFSASQPTSWAALSVWDSGGLFRLRLAGVSRATVAAARATRILDRVLPWLRIPSAPEIFRPFACLFLYGIAGEGPEAVKLVNALCGWAHNLGRKCGAGVVVAEVACCEPLRKGVPHWASLSFEDLWCIKRLGGGEGYSDGEVGDWTKSPPGTSIFVDPREV